MANSLHSFDGRLHVTILATEWESSEGGLSRINRELAIQLAKFPEVEITFFLPLSSEWDKRAALSHNIRIVEATRRIGFEKLDWLSFPPDDLQIDVVVGYGVKLGRQGQVIRQSHKCKWFQIVDTVPVELGMCGTPTKKREKYETELELCKIADFVVGVGRKTSEALRACFRWCKKDQTILDITPGVFDDFVNVEHATQEGKRCGVLVFGRGDAEDFHLKGFDIAGKAVAQLDYAHLYFVGALQGKQEEAAKRFLVCGIPANRLTVRSFHERHDSLKRLFCTVDLVLVPSRADEFGLAGQLAFSAGLPVLVSSTSGFGEALRQVPFGMSCVVDSDDAEVWAQAIKRIWNRDRKVRLEEAEVLRSSYQGKYSWAKQSQGLVEKMISITNVHVGPCFVKRIDWRKLPDHIRPHSELVYPMTSRPRGIALIINNEVFDQHSEADEFLRVREGSEKDVKALERLFEALHFVVRTERDIGGERIKKVLDDVSSEDHSAYNCFVLWLMSHGREGQFYGADGKIVLIETVRDFFSNAQCPTLKGKPKLLFVQACRGDQKEVGVAADSPYGSNQQPTTNVASNLNIRESMPAQADILMAYSTVSGYTSFRNPCDGSRFVQCIVEVFRECAGHEDILSMLTMVNNKICKMGSFDSKQVSEPMSTLRKKLYFWPGL